MTQRNGQTSGKPRLSLTEYAETEGVKNGVTCWMCTIPERAEVEEAILAGRVTKAAATRWLREVCGYDKSTPNRVTNHMERHAKRPA